MAFPPPGAVPPPFMPGAAGFPVMNMGVGMPTSGASPGGPGGPGLLAVPPQMAMSPVRLPMQPPLGVRPLAGLPLGMQPHTIMAPPAVVRAEHSHSRSPSARVPTMSPSVMKVATTVFVGNISDKASDTLVRQILLRCGRIEGWKRVQDASGKLQAFGFCEYADPESTLRSLRLLHDFRLGDKNLVVRVDAKTRKDLLKYVTKKTKTRDNEPVDDDTIEKEVAEIEEQDRSMAVLTQDIDEDGKVEDQRIMGNINLLVKENIEVLSSQSVEEDQLEQDVKEAMLAMAKQSGKVDPDTSLDDMDISSDMKTLISSEIKLFRQSYKRDEEKKKGRKPRGKDDRGRGREADEQEKPPEREREREQDKEKGSSSPRESTRSPAPRREREREHDRDRERDRDKEKEREKERERERDTDRARSPRRRSRSPRRTRSPHRPRDPESRRREREDRREREERESLREQEDHEERQKSRKQRERDKAYREKLSMWESRERRKGKECEKDYEKETSKKEEQDREKRHLAEFLEDYADDKDDQRYYKGSAYARRRRERELELEEDERDRKREREEIEALRLEVMERQHRKKLAERDEMYSSDEDQSPDRQKEEDDDMEVPVKVEMEEDIPLTKAGYTITPTYAPIQVHSAPAVLPPEIKDHPQEQTDGITIGAFEPVRPEVSGVRAEEEQSPESPQLAPKLAFGLSRKTSAAATSAVPSAKKPKLENVFSIDEDEIEVKPKRKLVPIDYSSEGEDKSSDKRERDREETIGLVAPLGGPLPSGDRKLSADEKKKVVQTLVNSIPTSKEEVFAYQLKWQAIDKSLMEKRIGPWINKKIMEYIGEEEPSLTEFICNKLACHVTAPEILRDISIVLDDEAEVFVVKLWRLLIYETEARHLGIAKTY